MEQLVSLIDSTRGKVVAKEEGEALAWACEKPGENLKLVGIKHSEMKDNEVRVKITYTSICQSDVSIVRNKYGGAMPTVWPTVCGHEIVGRIIKLGKDVQDFKENDLVGIGPKRECCNECGDCKRGNTNTCSGNIYGITAGSYFGGFATEIQLPSSFLLRIPDGLDEKRCPPLLCAGGTVFNPLSKYGAPGKKVGVIGIGGLGHLAIKMANKMDMKVFAISTSDSKKQAALDYGAHEYVVSTNTDQMNLLRKEELDIIINTGDQEEVMMYMTALKKVNGVFVQLSCPTTYKTDLNIVQMIFGEYTFAGSCCFSLKQGKEMLDFCNKHQIYADCEYFKWDEFQEAFEKCENGKVRFRSVVDVTSRNN